MALFGNDQPKSFVGVDIGNSAVKIVELEGVGHRAKLVTYGYVEQDNEIIRTDSPQARASIIAALSSVFAQANVRSTQVIASLPSYAVFTSIIHLPRMNKKDLATAVQWEAKKFVPMPLSEMVLDWKILDENAFRSTYVSAGGQGQMDMSQPPMSPVMHSMNNPATIESKEQSFYKILLTAAPKDLVTRYVEIFKAAKLNLIGIETESFAAERALIGNDPNPVMIIDMGAVATNFSIVVDGVPIIHRSIDIAGNTITKSIANSMNIPVDQAEQFKRDFGLTAQPVQPGTANTGVVVPRHIESLMAAVMNEIQYVLNLYQSQTNGPIEKIVLTGGSSWLPHIVEYMRERLQAKVFIGDPWAHVMYPDPLRDVLVQVGPRLSVAIGLGMRPIVPSSTVKG